MTMREKIQQLINETEAEIDHLQRLKKDVVGVRERFVELERISIHDTRGIAMLLTEIYVGAENLMLRIAKTFGEPMPSGKAWHKELLDQFSAEMPNTRPSLFKEKTAEQLDEFRRFRHVVHHVYSFHYDWEQIRKLLLMAEPLLVDLVEDAESFNKFLIEVISDK